MESSFSARGPTPGNLTRYMLRRQYGDVWASCVVGSTQRKRAKRSWSQTKTRRPLHTCSKIPADRCSFGVYTQFRGHRLRCKPVSGVTVLFKSVVSNPFCEPQRRRAACVPWYGLCHEFSHTPNCEHSSLHSTCCDHRACV